MPVSSYRERLWPGFGLFLVLLLIVPAVSLVLTPINGDIAIPVAVVVYVLVAGTIALMSPVLAVDRGAFIAGRARIPVAQLGEVELLEGDALRRAIGPDLDARSYLTIRGWIHRGLRIENIDPQDPAPYWIVTTRRPALLAEAIDSARRE